MPGRADNLAGTGVPGLDEILAGGLPRDRIYLLQGDPGVGKTTLGLQFLREGVRLGEKCLYIALSETESEIRGVVESHGWTLDGIDVVELSALDQSAGLEAENTLFEPAEVELHETTRMLLAHVERIKPDRVVFDSLSELRLLAQSALRYRRQILGLKQYFGGKRSTVVLLDDRTSEANDQQLQSLAHGVISMEQNAPLYGEDRRRIRVSKLRSVQFRGGYHDFAIRRGGAVVFPRLVAAEHGTSSAADEPDRVSSGVEGLDRLLGGGLDRGTAMLALGPAGSGKSTIAIQYAVAAALRDERAALYLFDERVATMYLRMRALGVDLAPHVASGRITLQQIDPAEMSAGEFAGLVKASVEAGARVVIIDSLNGYLQAMPEDRQLTIQMHELLAYLANKRVTTLLVLAQHGLVGTMQSQIDLSYLADTVVLLRYFEAYGRIRKAVSVLKKRSGAHENTISELTLDGGGLHVGAALDHFRGVLTGVPHFEGPPGELAE